MSVVPSLMACASWRSVQAKNSWVEPQEVFQLVLLTQFFDVVKGVGEFAGAKVIFMPYTPGGIAEIASQIRTSVIAGNEAAKADFSHAPVQAPTIERSRFCSRKFPDNRPSGRSLSQVGMLEEWET